MTGPADDHNPTRALTTFLGPSFGDPRPWELARQLGFIAGGGAQWFAKTLSILSEGDRVWVNVPKTGYVGVGIVTGVRERADHHRFETPDRLKNLSEMGEADGYRHLHFGPDDETAEYLEAGARADSGPWQRLGAQVDRTTQSAAGQIAHIGVGAFHRAHEARYLERCNRLTADASAGLWTITDIGLPPGDRDLMYRLTDQGGRYSLNVVDWPTH